MHDFTSGFSIRSAENAVLFVIGLTVIANGPWFSSVNLISALC